MDIVSYVGLANKIVFAVKPNGFGKDIWAVPPENVTEFLKVSMPMPCFERVLAWNSPKICSQQLLMTPTQ